MVVAAASSSSSRPVRPRGSSAGRRPTILRSSSQARLLRGATAPKKTTESGTMTTEQVVCDYYDNPTLLSRYILRQQYDLAVARLRAHPEEARVWVRRARQIYKSNNKKGNNSNNQKSSNHRTVHKMRGSSKHKPQSPSQHQSSPISTIYNPHDDNNNNDDEMGQYSEEEETAAVAPVVDVVFQCLPLHLACHNLGLYNNSNGNHDNEPSNSTLLPLRQQLQNLIAKLIEAFPGACRCPDQPYRQYPLHMCLRHGVRLSLIKQLLVTGAASVMTVPDGDGATPAEWNALCTHNDKKRHAIQQLLQKGCAFWTEVRKNHEARRAKQQQQQQQESKNDHAADDDSAVWSQLQAALRGDEAENAQYDYTKNISGGGGGGRTPLAWSQLEERGDRLEALLVAALRRERHWLLRQQQQQWTGGDDDNDDTAVAVCSHNTTTASSTDCSPPVSAKLDYETDRLRNKIDRLEAANRRCHGRIADLTHQLEHLTWFTASGSGGGGGGGGGGHDVPQQPILDGDDEYFEQLRGYTNNSNNNNNNDYTSSIFVNDSNSSNSDAGVVGSAATTSNNNNNSNNAVPMDTSGVSSLTLSGVSVNWDAPPAAPSPQPPFMMQQRQRPLGMLGDHSHSRGATPVRQHNNSKNNNKPVSSPLLSSSPPGATRGRLMAMIQEGGEGGGMPPPPIPPVSSPQRRQGHSIQTGGDGGGDGDLLCGIASPEKHSQRQPNGGNSNHGWNEITYFYTDDEDNDDDYDCEMDTAAAQKDEVATSRGNNDARRGFVPIPEYEFYDVDDDGYDSFDVVQVDGDDYYDDEDLDSILAEVQEKKGSKLSPKIVRAWNNIELDDDEPDEYETHQEEEADVFDMSSSRSALSRISERDEVEDSTSTSHHYHEDITVDRESYEYERSFLSTPRRTNTTTIGGSYAQHDIIVTPIFDDMSSPFRIERALV